MLGLGTGIQYPSSLSLIPLVLAEVAIVDTDDENVAVVIKVTDIETKTALLDGITQSTGAKVNGTATLTVENHDTLGSNSHRIGTKTFNIFQYTSSGQVFYFLSTATSDITIGGDPDNYEAVDLTVATFLDSGGSDANLDAAGTGEIYDFDVFISISGFEDSNVVVIDNVSIDAA
mgnify:FL=1|tara:strand:- start:34 stop:558 length:525 start_codon:yes stop_codon:yes gene_type:complete